MSNGIFANEDIFYIFAINGKDISIQIPKVPNIRVIKRENIGHDFGAWKTCLDALDSAKMSFKYYIFMNDTVAGPFLPRYMNEEKWYKMFCCLINDEVKLSGLSINYDPWDYGKANMQHVQSMMFCTDQIGFRILKKEIFHHEPAEFQAIYNKKRSDFIAKFEIGMSRKILNKGYRIAALYVADALNVRTGDVWFNGEYFESTINPFETMFIKANRISSSIINLYTNYMLKNHTNHSSSKEFTHRKRTLLDRLLPLRWLCKLYHFFVRQKKH
jgi:hypothetical protein